MYTTEGASAVATITELRSETSLIIEHTQKTGQEILIQKNNEPQAIVMSWDTYLKIKEKVDLSDL